MEVCLETGRLIWLTGCGWNCGRNVGNEFNKVRKRGKFIVGLKCVSLGVPILVDRSGVHTFLV